MFNYFELMNLPQQFNVDMAQLQQTMRQLQSMFHPDNHIDAALPEQPNSSIVSDISANPTVAKLALLQPEQASAIINEAYHTLKNPDSRASHLLALKGIAQSINEPIRDLDFLDEAMSFRIDLEDANSQALDPLNQRLIQWLGAYEDKFNQVYQTLDQLQPIDDNYQTSVTQALDMIQKLQFLVKLQADVAQKTDELAKQSFDSDDDLYV